MKLYIGLTGYEFELFLDYACDCPTECTEIKYETIVSNSIYPSPQQFPIALASVNPTNLSMTLADFRKTYLIANFYLETMQYTVIEESQLIGLLDLINALGGTFGLCLGGSFMSLVEIMFAIYYLIRGAIRSQTDQFRGF